MTCWPLREACHPAYRPHRRTCCQLRRNGLRMWRFLRSTYSRLRQRQRPSNCPPDCTDRILPGQSAFAGKAAHSGFSAHLHSCSRLEGNANDRGVRRREIASIARFRDCFAPSLPLIAAESESPVDSSVPHAAAQHSTSIQSGAAEMRVAGSRSFRHTKADPQRIGPARPRILSSSREAGHL
jgi:hypothetical protein